MADDRKPAGQGQSPPREASPSRAAQPPHAPTDAGPAAAATVDLPERVHGRLLELFVCPVTKTTLTYDEKRQELISRAAGLAYPIRNGVPLLTVEAARPLDDVRGSPPSRP